MDETQQLLRIFGVAVTDFEAEAEKLKSVAEQFTAGTDKAEVAGHVTQRVFEAQNELLARCAEAADKAS